jgi:hypothetical protein
MQRTIGVQHAWTSSAAPRSVAHQVGVDAQPEQVAVLQFPILDRLRVHLPHRRALRPKRDRAHRHARRLPPATTAASGCRAAIHRRRMHRKRVHRGLQTGLLLHERRIRPRMLRVHANLPVRAAVVRRLRADTLLACKAPRLLASEVQLRGSAVAGASAEQHVRGCNPLHLVVQQLNSHGRDLKRRHFAVSFSVKRIVTRGGTSGARTRLSAALGAAPPLPLAFWYYIFNTSVSVYYLIVNTYGSSNEYLGLERFNI